MDHSVRRKGPLLIGGSPLRLVRLGTGGAKVLDRWLAGEPLGPAATEQRLARRLVDAGLLHPIQPPELTAAEVTLVVPVKDNPDGVARLVAATPELAGHIVVDDGSSPPLPSSALRHDTPRGPAAARNAGWRTASTRVVAFLDSDTLPEPGWLEPLLRHFSDPAVVAVAPRIRSSPGDTALADYEAGRSSLDLGSRPAPVRPLSRVSYVPSAALLVRRDALAAVSGFDEALRFGEDVDLVWKLLGHGAVRYEPSSVVSHLPRPSPLPWLRQRFEYGTSAAPLALRHAGLLTPARLSAWSAASWALLAAGAPRAALTLAAGSSALLPRKLRSRGIPVRESLRLAALGHLGAGRLLAEATRRAWWPLLLPTARGRRILLAALLPCLLEWLRERRGRTPSWLVLRVADDLAYGAGVWAGAVRERTAAPLLPRFTEGPLR
ncbi:mycofactocin biosynthesis glycosyltransferase MftF [Saccharomonospora sp. NPDC006951]